MKIMTINTWQGRLLRPLMNLVRDVAPDIVFTQEIYSFAKPVAGPSPFNYFYTLEMMAKEGDYSHVFFSPCVTFPMFDAKLSFGNAILSKFPLSETSSHYTGRAQGPQHRDDPGEYDGNLTRNFQHAITATPEGKIHLINQHGFWLSQPMGNDESVTRTMQLANYASGLGGPTLIAGDFNLVPASQAMRHLTGAGFIDHTAEAGINMTLSAAHFVSEPIACDYILSNGRLKVSDVHTSDRLVSDHKAVIAKVTA